MHTNLQQPQRTSTCVSHIVDIEPTVQRKWSSARPSNSKCRCHHRAPPLRVIRSVEFNRELARKISDLGLSGDATVDLVLTELLDHCEGALLDAGGKPIDFAGEKPADVARWDGLFSEDQRRFVNRYKDRARDSGFKNRLQERLVFTVTAMHFAMAIRACRQSGRCIAT